MRIRMPRGHLELSVAGVTLKPDEEGAFDVPDSHGLELIAVHGAERAPLLADFDAEVQSIELRIAQTKQSLTLLEDDLKAARGRAEAAKARAKKAAEKAVADKAAADEAAKKAAGAGGKAAG
jgi:hypothetical protein